MPKLIVTIYQDWIIDAKIANDFILGRWNERRRRLWRIDRPEII